MTLQKKIEEILEDKVCSVGACLGLTDIAKAIADYVESKVPKKHIIERLGEGFWCRTCNYESDIETCPYNLCVDNFHQSVKEG